MQAPDDFNPIVGMAEVLTANVRRIVAPNPSPMTYRGTNTYLVGTQDLAVIDPGPLDISHLEAILAACDATQRITHIMVSHTHLDHSPLAKPLSERTGAPVWAFGTAQSGRSQIMDTLAASGLTDGGEGIDHAFVPDHVLQDGQSLEGDDWRLEAIHTPGHLGNHICMALGDLCFTADHVMGWASSLVSPPDGDLTDFMASCARLQERDWRRFFPGHGATIDAPHARLEWLIRHRKSRETAILDALGTTPATARTLTQAVYTDTPTALLPAAERNVLAHLIDLMNKSKIKALGPLNSDARFSRL
ncbi:MBL fold metallo-hydrolase [Tateyamaria pelophila]|uniref:MBL fold metallo-hydrolase n=1 Tax=Tateyamaria pelophila TaxID=328415 RepID=UPI001CBBECCB|nr:MBL fold metallo-hydrolase [Tateyamaria pelophila]